MHCHLPPQTMTFPLAFLTKASSTAFYFSRFSKASSISSFLLTKFNKWVFCGCTLFISSLLLKMNLYLFVASFSLTHSSSKSLKAPSLAAFSLSNLLNVSSFTSSGFPETLSAAVTLQQKYMYLLCKQ